MAPGLGMAPRLGMAPGAAPLDRTRDRAMAVPTVVARLQIGACASIVPGDVGRIRYGNAWLWSFKLGEHCHPLGLGALRRPRRPNLNLVASRGERDHGRGSATADRRGPRHHADVASRRRQNDIDGGSIRHVGRLDHDRD